MRRNSVLIESIVKNMEKLSTLYRLSVLLWHEYGFGRMKNNESNRRAE